MDEPEFVWRIVKGVIENFENLNKIIEKVRRNGRLIKFPLSTEMFYGSDYMNYYLPIAMKCRPKWRLTKRLNWPRITAVPIQEDLLMEF